MNNAAQENRIHYLYRVTNKINGKIYIGQTVKPSARWWQHRNDSVDPKVPFHFAIKKYGSHNFEFEIIASCKGFDNANEMETVLVAQYDSYVSNGKGYNASHGGMNAPKTEAFKQMMRDYHASLTPEERVEISRQQSEATYRQIAEKGHPAAGRIVTEEEKELHRKARLENPIEYTKELRQKMSETHIGLKDSEETKAKKAESAKEAWKKRIDYSRKCAAEGCQVYGKAKYKIINNIRYCNKHGLRMLRYNRLDTLDS
ncbi:MAG: GIY-YIG nuclease family protein [Candidatus Berkiella sp.]